MDFDSLDKLPPSTDMINNEAASGSEDQGFGDADVSPQAHHSDTKIHLNLSGIHNENIVNNYLVLSNVNENIVGCENPYATPRLKIEQEIVEEDDDPFGTNNIEIEDGDNEPNNETIQDISSIHQHHINEEPSVQFEFRNNVFVEANNITSKVVTPQKHISATDHDIYHDVDIGNNRTTSSTTQAFFTSNPMFPIATFSNTLPIQPTSPYSKQDRHSSPSSNRHRTSLDQQPPPEIPTLQASMANNDNSVFRSVNHPSITVHHFSEDSGEFAAALSKQLANKQLHHDDHNFDMNDGDDSPSFGPNHVYQNSSSLDDDLVITSENNNIGTSRKQDKYLSSIVDGDTESFAPTRSSSPPIEHHTKKKTVEEYQSLKNSNEEGKQSTGEALGSAFKRLKTKKKNLSFSKFSGNLKNITVMKKGVIEDYTSDIERGHAQLLEACDEFFDKCEGITLSTCKSSNLLKKIDSTSIDKELDKIISKIEGSHWEYGYHLLSIVMGYVGTQGSGGSTSVSKANCNLIIESNALPTILMAFKHHAFALADIQIKRLIDTEKFEKECKEKEKWFNLYSNILYIFLTIQSWNPTQDVLEELKYDLFERGVISRSKYGQKQDSEHFFLVLVKLLKKTLFNEVSDIYNIHSLKKLCMLMHKTLHILFLCDVDNIQKKKGYTKLTKVLEKERAKHLKLKVNTETKAAYIKENKGNIASKLVEEALDIYNKAPEKKENNNNTITLPRALIETPSTTETLYRLMIEDLPDFVLTILTLLDKTTKGELGTGFVGSEQKRRYCNILLKSILSVVLLMIKNWRKSCQMQAKYFIHLLAEADTQVLLFRLLDLEVKSYIAQDESNSEVNFMRGDIKNNQSISNSVNDFPKPNWRNVYVLTVALRIIHQMTKDDQYLMSKLIRKHKMHRTLKKVLQVEDIESLCKYSCKILKNCLPQLPLKWKTTNMLVVNNIYFHVRPTLTDTSWIQSLNATIQISQSEYLTEMKKIRDDIQNFHADNYFDWWKNFGWRSVDKVAKIERQISEEYDHLVFSEDNGLFGEHYVSFMYNSIELSDQDKKEALLL